MHVMFVGGQGTIKDHSSAEKNPYWRKCVNLTNI